MDYHRARYYHPQLRRFLNQDSMRGSITRPAGMNPFAYANGEPISGIDPLGLVRWGELASASLGLVTNTIGIATSITLAAVPDPTLLTKVAAGTLAFKSGYGLSASGLNFWDALVENDPRSKGSFAKDVANLAAPGNENAQKAAAAIDLTTDLAIGRISANVAERALGPMVDPRGFPLYDAERVFLKDPSDLGKFADTFVAASLLQEGYEGFGKDILFLEKHSKCEGRQ